MPDVALDAWRSGQRASLLDALHAQLGVRPARILGTGSRGNAAAGSRPRLFNGVAYVQMASEADLSAALRACPGRELRWEERKLRVEVAVRQSFRNTPSKVEEALSTRPAAFRPAKKPQRTSYYARENKRLKKALDKLERRRHRQVDASIREGSGQGVEGTSGTE